MPDEHLGERSCAFLIFRRKAVMPERALREFLRQSGLASYKIPDLFQAVSAFPLTAAGKTSKRQLRELAAEYANHTASRQAS
ncbi:hypothetical protein [Alkalilimnicola ehrlichii]|nr:hypothetical protein [Alkalilimnicola ehrlichii]